MLIVLTQTPLEVPEWKETLRNYRTEAEENPLTSEPIQLPLMFPYSVFRNGLNMIIQLRSWVPQAHVLQLQ